MFKSTPTYGREAIIAMGSYSVISNMGLHNTTYSVLPSIMITN